MFAAEMARIAHTVSGYVLPVVLSLMAYGLVLSAHL